MKILLKFIVRNKQYGILEDSKNSASNYINDLTKAFKSRHILISMKHNGHGKYTYKLKNGRLDVSVQPIDNATSYVLSILSKESKKTYASNSFDALKSNVYNKLDYLGYDATPEEDAQGQWSITDGNAYIHFRIQIVDRNGHAVDYLDPIKMISVDPNFASLPVLGDDDNTPRGVIKTKNLRALAILETFSCLTSVSLGELFVAIETNLCIDEIVKKYRSQYLIKPYLERFYELQLKSLIISIVINSIVLAVPALYFASSLSFVLIGFRLLYITIILFIFLRSRKKLEN